MGDMQNELIKAAVKSGMIGIVLAWALWENSRIVDRAFKVVENNTKALQAFESACSEKLGMQ